MVDEQQVPRHEASLATDLPGAAWMAERNRQRTVIVRYRNHRGEVADRRIVPVGIHYGASEWHPERQWLLVAVDLDRGADRTFALKDIIGEWRPEA